MDLIREQNATDVKENYIKHLNNALLSILLKDKTSGKNLIWATDTYAWRGRGFGPQDHITTKAVTGKRGNVIKPRTEKSKTEKQQRIKNNAEVFTPAWICNKQNNLVDNAWFGRENVFNTEIGKEWITATDKILFPEIEGKRWQDYVKANRMEISCGEAPYLTSRYDTVSGDFIESKNRIGMLDRKLRVIGENVDDEQEWYEWAVIAYKSIYGFDFQGDNVLIARENLLFSFIDAYSDKFGVLPAEEYLREISKILAWNIWQMDGLKFVIPYSCKHGINRQSPLADNETAHGECEGCKKNDNANHTGIYCRIMNRSTKRTETFLSQIRKKTNERIQGDLFIQKSNTIDFDAIVGNPPYQIMDGGAQASSTPVYNLFVEMTEKIGPVYISVIMPSRWMTGGKGLEKFRSDTINDKRFAKLYDYYDASVCFDNVDIKGGICYFLWNRNHNGECDIYTVIGNKTITSRRYLVDGEDDIYIRDSRLISIKNKVNARSDVSFDTIVSVMKPYGLRGDFFKNPSKYSLPPISDEVIGNGYAVIGLDEKLHRIIKYVDKNYPFPKRDCLNDYKIFIARNYGSGELGEIPSTPILAEPGMACTETFIQIGPFSDRQQAENCFGYMKTKFFRLLVGIRKRDQGAGKNVYSLVPMQSFDKSWTDEELYKKYGLDSDDITFIEQAVKKYE